MNQDFYKSCAEEARRDIRRATEALNLRLAEQQAYEYLRGRYSDEDIFQIIRRDKWRVMLQPGDKPGFIQIYLNHNIKI